MKKEEEFNKQLASETLEFIAQLIEALSANRYCLDKKDFTKQVYDIVLEKNVAFDPSKHVIPTAGSVKFKIKGKELDVIIKVSGFIAEIGNSLILSVPKDFYDRPIRININVEGNRGYIGSIKKEGGKYYYSRGLNMKSKETVSIGHQDLVDIIIEDCE